MEKLSYVLTKTFGASVPVHIFFTAAHFHLAMAASISHLSHRRYEIVMFSFQRNPSPLFSITRSSSFSVILVSVDIEKDSGRKRLDFVVVFSL